jgi:hypothetical protein
MVATGFADLEKTAMELAMKISRQPIFKERVRSINGQGFSFFPHRFLRDGFFVSLSSSELAFYFLLVLAGDRNGISYYHYDSLCSMLQIPVETYIEARNGLIAKDLIGFDGTRFQVLSLPKKPVLNPPEPLKTKQGFEDEDPATIRTVIKRSLGIED